MNRGGFGNMQQLMAQAQRMQVEMQRKQEMIAQTERTANSGGGMVSVTVNGAHRVTKVAINPDAVDPDDVEMLEDLVLTAINAAMNEIDEFAQKELEGVTGGMSIPGLTR
jgi:hypothetical protein